jgi:hypothetical protein
MNKDDKPVESPNEAMDILTELQNREGEIFLSGIDMQNLQDIIDIIRNKDEALSKVKTMINEDYDNEDIIDFINDNL